MHIMSIPHVWSELRRDLFLALYVLYVNKILRCVAGFVIKTIRYLSLIK